MSLFRRRRTDGEPKLPECLVPLLREYGVPCPNPDGVSPYHRGYIERTIRLTASNPYRHGTDEAMLWMLGCLDRAEDEADNPRRPFSARRTV